MINFRQSNPMKRVANPNDIKVPNGYKVEVFAQDLFTPINLIITDEGEMLLADAGMADGNGKVLKLTPNGFQVIAEGFSTPLTGINYLNGDIYVSHRGFVTVIKADGTMEDIIAGLPSWGDHHNNQVVFGPDGKLYFGQGTATNSGVVGEDNKDWVQHYPFFHDYPSGPIALRGQNYVTPNFLRPNEKNVACTGAYSPFGVPSSVGEIIRGIIPVSGSVLRANLDGSNLELVAWGLRNPFRMKFDNQGRLFCANQGMDVRGSRPVANSPDEFQLIVPGVWYGWPDYSGGLPVTMPMFKPTGSPAPTFLLLQHPMIPPRPFANFPNHSAVMGFAFNQNPSFGKVGDAYLSEFGSEAPETTGGQPDAKVGHRVSKLDMETKEITDFATNKIPLATTNSNTTGLSRPIDVVFDKDGAMYVVDFGIFPPPTDVDLVPNTGIIWKIAKNK